VRVVIEGCRALVLRLPLPALRSTPDP